MEVLAFFAPIPVIDGRDRPPGFPGPGRDNPFTVGSFARQEHFGPNDPAAAIVSGQPDVG
jgi:hypothetical protein